MKNNKNVRKDNLSPVENGSKRIYKMYKSKKNWVVAPVVLLTLLGAVAPAPIALTNVVNAEETTVVAATDTTKQDALSKLNTLKGYGFDVSAQENSIKSATNQADVYTAVLNAYKLVTTDTAKKLVSNYDNIKKAVEDAATAGKVTSTEKDALLGALKSSATTEANTYVTTVGGYTSSTTDLYKNLIDQFTTLENASKKVEAANNDVKTLLDSYVTGNVSADAKVTAANAIVDGLKNLSEAQKAAYDASIVAAQNTYTQADKSTDVNAKNALDTLINAVDTALSTAKEADATNLSNDVTAVKSLSAYTGLSSELQKQYSDKLDAAKTLDAVKAIKDELVANELANKRQSALDETINVNYGSFGAYYTTGTATETLAKKQAIVDYFKGLVNKADTTDKVTSVTNDFETWAGYANMTAAKAVVTVSTIIGDTPTPNLDATARAEYTSKYERLATTASPLELKKLVDEIVAANTKALEDAKTAAETEVKGLANLPKADLEKALQDIKDAANVSGVKTAIDNAKAAVVDPELKAAKDKATEAIKTWKAADEATYISAVNAETTVNGVNKVFAEKANAYLGTSNTSAFGKNDVKDIKPIALAVLDTLGLSDSDLAKAKAVVNASDATVATIYDGLKPFFTKTVDIAQNAITQAALVKAQEDANKAIDSLSYLSDAQKADFKSQVAKATTTAAIGAPTDLATADTIVGKAKKANETAKTLATVTKPEAVRKVLALENLTSAQKADYQAKILAASDSATVDSLVAQAQSLDLQQETDLATFKAKAATADTGAIAKLPNLTNDEITAYNNAVNAATTLEAAKDAFNKAVVQSNKATDAETVKSLKSLYDNGKFNEGLAKAASLNDEKLKAEWTEKFADAVKLENAKTAAIDTIRKADYLTEKQTNDFVKNVNAATSTADVDKVLDEVKALAPATAVQLYRA
ncbi:KxYKxGKxW signal peptide domain-containing protein, partial [Enterococcus columbae]